jgi:hypothetical protein
MFHPRLHFMKTLPRLLCFPPILFITLALCGPALAQTEREIPSALKPWEKWATWEDRDSDCPPGYQDPAKRFCAWPSRVAISADRHGGSFEFDVEVFAKTWVGLPGGRDVWPSSVSANGEPLPVIERGETPSVFLPPGTHRINGAFFWKEIPQTIPLPPDVGMVSLSIDGRAVELPEWDARGQLWLRRDRTREGETAKDFLGVQVYGLIEDGIPMWLRTEIELVVAGKSREEQLGGVLPEGWKLAAVDSPIPVAVDDAGRVKAQVRPGKWKVRLDAFSLDNPQEVGFAPGVKPAIQEELIAFQSRPDFRMVDIVGIPVIDVSQTPFPDAWRPFPVYRWATDSPFQIEERMRGMGMQRPAGLDITRTLWLNEIGTEIIFRDQIAGGMQEIWRLDAAGGVVLGSVRGGGVGQLITRNPETGAPGVEIRMRQIDLEATGSMEGREPFSSTGWSADADSARVELHLPPGWRLLALFGADWVEGDWLGSWTLLDLFLLLVFSLAVFRLWGAGPALLAFAAFGLAYHEPGAPRYLWLALLVPLALLRVVPSGRGRRLLLAWKWATVGILLLVLAPFVAQQVQQALYPQLEQPTHSDMAPEFMARPTPAAGFETEVDAIVATAPEEEVAESPPPPRRRGAAYSDGLLSSTQAAAPAYFPMKSRGLNTNLLYDAKAKIQTGPGVPDWTWRTVQFGWNGPVKGSQLVSPVWIPMSLERALSVFRVLLLLGLAAILLDARRLRSPLFGAAHAPALLLATLLAASSAARAQFPDKELIDTLRERLLEPSAAFPHAAEIPSVSISLVERKISMEVEVHTAARVAVPLPGKLPAWSPVRVIPRGSSPLRSPPQ